MSQGLLLYWTLSSSGHEIWQKASHPEFQPPEEIFLHSSIKNIVHVVLDGFQSDVFWELVEEEGLGEELDGFVYFRENSAVAPHTSFSMPAVFSGRVYDGSTNPESYYRRPMEDGLTDRLLDHGFSVKLIPKLSMRQSRYTHLYKIPSVYLGSESDLIRRNATFLFDLSLFRQLLHLLRKWVYNKNSWRLTFWLNDPQNIPSLQQKIFFKDYIEWLSTAQEKPAYHFLHLWPPHPPFVTSRSGNYAGSVLPVTRENYKERGPLHSETLC